MRAAELVTEDTEAVDLTVLISERSGRAGTEESESVEVVDVVSESLEGQ
jgi:hypothetical protein